MGKLTENASKTFRRRKNVHVPAFFSWAQYVALALIPIFYFSYFVFNKPSSYVIPKTTLVVSSSTTGNISADSTTTSDSEVSYTTSQTLVSIKSFSGSKIKVESSALALAKLVGVAYFNGNWGPIQVVGTLPTSSTLYPRARVVSVIGYSCDVSSCVLGANVDKDGNGSSDESIQFTLVKQNNQWFYEGN